MDDPATPRAAVESRLSNDEERAKKKAMQEHADTLGSIQMLDDDLKAIHKSAATAGGTRAEGFDTILHGIDLHTIHRRL